MKERSDTIGSRLSGRSADGPWTAQYKVIEDKTNKDNIRESNNSRDNNQPLCKSTEGEYSHSGERQYDYGALEEKLFN